MTSKLSKNVVERGAWTLAQCALGFLATELADVSPAYAPMVAAVLSFAKNIVAERLAASNGWQRVQKTKAAPQEREAETAHSSGGEQADLSETDALLDEIDSILEEQDVLINYRRRGGE